MNVGERANSNSSKSHNFGREFKWLWIEALIFAVCTAPAVMFFKDQYPWVVLLAVAVGAVVVGTSNFIMTMKLETKERKEQESKGIRIRSHG